MPRINPYEHLRRQFAEFARKVQVPRTKGMWLYPKDKLGSNWQLVDLYERVAAANQMGYDVVLVAQPDGLNVRYVEKRPTPPSNIW